MATLSTLRKGIEVMFLFTEAEPSLSLHEIAGRLKLPRSTVYRFVHTLRDSGVLAQDPESRRYRLGSRLLDLQVAISRPVDLRTAAIPLMRELVALSDETAHLTERRGDLAVITEVVESPHILRMAPRRGQSFPLHAGALSRAILALLPPVEIERILRARRPKRFTPNSPASPAALAKALRDVQEHGWALSVQEVTPGACGISAPIVDRDGWAIGSLGISGPMHRLTEERRAALVGPVRDAARNLSALIRREGLLAERGPR
jgi:IclR family transcriptional regulator, KDG regulon repressor